jgi:hypothetical protein
VTRQRALCAETIQNLSMFVQTPSWGISRRIWAFLLTLRSATFAEGFGTSRRLTRNQFAFLSDRLRGFLTRPTLSTRCSYVRAHQVHMSSHEPLVSARRSGRRDDPSEPGNERSGPRLSKTRT